MASWQHTPLFVLVIATFSLRPNEATTGSYLQVYPPDGEDSNSTPLHFALVLSFGGEYLSIGALPGVQIALDYINNEPSILPGYSLHYTLTYSEV